jgi:hypothetical protein
MTTKPRVVSPFRLPSKAELEERSKRLARLLAAPLGKPGSAFKDLLIFSPLCAAEKS